MKLSTLLGHILTTPSMRTGKEGVCTLIPSYLYMEFVEARKACTQTTSLAYPVEHPDCTGRTGAGVAFYREDHWRGKYGISRRKLVRDCWRWAKERGL